MTLVLRHIATDEATTLLVFCLWEINLLEMQTAIPVQASRSVDISPRAKVGDGATAVSATDSCVEGDLENTTTHRRPLLSFLLDLKRAMTLLHYPP